MPTVSTARGIAVDNSFGRGGRARFVMFVAFSKAGRPVWMPVATAYFQQALRNRNCNFYIIRPERYRMTYFHAQKSALFPASALVSNPVRLMPSVVGFQPVSQCRDGSSGEGIVATLRGER